MTARALVFLGVVFFAPSLLAAPALPNRDSGGNRAGNSAGGGQRGGGHQGASSLQGLGQDQSGSPRGGLSGQGQLGEGHALPSTLPSGLALPGNTSGGGAAVTEAANQAVESAREAATEALSVIPGAGATVTTGDVAVEAEAEPALEAHGDGSIQLLGSLSISASGRGTLHIDGVSQVVWDDPERVQVAQEGNGLRYEVSSTSNSVQIVGANVQMTLEGESLRVTVYGNGTATLRGSGSYSQPGRSARWSDGGETIVLQGSVSISSITSTLTTRTVSTPSTLPGAAGLGGGAVGVTPPGGLGGAPGLTPAGGAGGAVGPAGLSGPDHPQGGSNRGGGRASRNR